MSDDIDTIRVMTNPPSPPTGGDEVSAKSQPRRVKQSFYFTVVLYPDEDPKHTMLAEYIKSHYECAWIQHTKMYDTDPKSHVHMLFRLQSRSTIRGVNRFFQIDHCELVENLQSMLQYFVHDTPACIMDYDNGNGDSTGWTYYTTVSAPQTNYISLLRSWSSYNPYLVDGVKSSQFSISPLWDSYGWVGVVTFAGIYQDGLQQALQPDYTYHLQYAFTNGNLNTFAPILSSGSRVTVFVTSTTGGSLGSQLTYVIPSDQISCTVTNSLGTNRTYIDIVFSTAGVTMVGDNSLDTYRYVAVPVYCQTDGKCVLEFVEMTGTQDPDLNVFRQNLLDILSEYANQNHTDLTNIYDVLFNQFTDLMGGDDSVQGDPYDGAVYDDMTEAEKDVFDSIDDFTVDFDGNTIQIDKNTFNVLMQYTNAHAHGYNTNVGVLLNRVVTVFTDYLAVPMVFSLLLGLVVWFMGKPVGG